MKKRWTIAWCIGLIGSMSYAQNSENKIQKIKNAFQSEAFQLSGYGHIQYNLSEYPERSLAPAKANNSIDIVRALLFATGKLGANNQFGYMLMFDLGPNTKMYELYGEWLPSKAINVRFGQFKIPFTIENPVSLSRIETIHPSRSVSAMSGSTHDFNQWEEDGKSVNKTGRDAGFQLYGSLFPADRFFRLEYYAGIFNGSGMNAKDNNNHKDFLATAYFYPVKELKLGGSFYSGKYPQYMQSYLLGNSLSTRRWTIGAEYKDVHFSGRAEYIQSVDGSQKRRGYYGLFMWKYIPNQWEILGKYDYYNKDVSFGKNAISDITFGINYYFAYLSRVQLNYIYTDNQAEGRNHALAVQLQLFF
ncbi:MAG: OprO/OprP family phosphate-selective porin [Candidatus Azobacteroides sp.]|nr:OprO/OprP family phosphate-selective porin [Candidatus Azobacteroides sp.]